MSNVRRFVLAALAGSVLAAAQPALAQTTLTMSSWVSPTHHITAVVLQGWATEAEKATNGRVKFQMLPKHPSAPPGTFDAVRDGLVDLSYVTASYTPARHILPLMAELPGAGETALINSVAYSRIYWKYFDKVGEYKGVKLLGVFTHGPGQMFTKRPVASINDIQGLKIRTGAGIREAAGLAGASWDEADRKGMEALKKSGVKIVNANPELVAEVKKRSAPIVDDWIIKAKAKGVDAPKVLAEFREELKKVAAGK